MSRSVFGLLGLRDSEGVGFGRGCEGAIVDGAGREGVAAVNPVAETPAER